MIDTVYVVIGMCGDYSDHREWLVASFTTETRAKDWADKCVAESERVVKHLTEQKLGTIGTATFIRAHTEMNVKVREGTLKAGSVADAWYMKRVKELREELNLKYDVEMTTDGNEPAEYVVCTVSLDPLEPADG